VCREEEAETDFEKVKRQRSQTDDGFPSTTTAKEPKFACQKNLGDDRSATKPRSRILSEEVINNPEASEPIVSKE